jgi:PAS domain S-box-containing protein
MEKGLIYAVVRDITRQKKMEEQLRQNEERLSFAMEGSGSGVWDWNMQINESIYSKTWKSMLGYEEDEITSTPDEWHSRIHPDDIQIVETEHSKYFNGETSNYACEYRMRCKNGEYKWVLSSGKIMQWDKNGKPLRMTGIHTDITELKNLIEEYRKITLDYQIIFNGTQDAMFLVSADENERLRFIRLNEIHEKLTGFTTEMVAGFTPPEVLGEDLGNIVENNYLRCYKEKRPIQYEEVMNLPTGEKVWHTLLSPVIRDGKVAYIVGSSRDITEQRHMEELKRNADKKIEQLKESIAQENLRTEFFANLSHELRTPLNVIFASIQVVNLKLNQYTDPALRNNLGKYLKKLNIQKAMLITDEIILNLDLTQKILEIAKGQGITFTVFSKVLPEPPVENVYDALKLYEANGCDGVVGLGGGSAMDVAKAVAMLVTNKGKYEDYAGIGKVPKKCAPLILMPTTSGTGSVLCLHGLP